MLLSFGSDVKNKNYLTYAPDPYYYPTVCDNLLDCTHDNTGSGQYPVRLDTTL